MSQNKNQQNLEGKKNLRNQHPQFFQGRSFAPKGYVKRIFDDAASNRQKTVQESVDYIRTHKQAMRQFYQYQNYGFKAIIQKAAFNKIVNQTMQKHNLTRHQAVLSLLYDDFLGGLFQRGKKEIGDFWSKNKDQILSLLRVLATQIAPRVILGSQYQICSQDPYAIDQKYLRSLFTMSQVHSMPKKLIDPLGLMQNEMQIPVTTGSGGNCIITICPQNVAQPSFTPASTSLWAPFAAMSSSNTNLCYNGATIYAGPFNGQRPNITGQYIEQLKTSFLCTQSLLNASGKIYCGVFYEDPNKSFSINVGIIDLLSTAITTSEILNATRANDIVNVASCVEKRTHTGRWIANGADYTNDLYTADNFVGGPAVNEACFVVLYFTGCTPSTTIGQLYIKSGMAHKPIATQQGIYDLKVRGSYPGTDLWIHQLKKSGMNLQFVSQDQIAPYIVNNFSKLRLGGEGFCVDQALRELGLPTFGRPWISIVQLENRYPGLAVYINGNDSNVPPGSLIVDLKRKHAYVKKKVDQVVARTTYGRNVWIGDPVHFYNPSQDVTMEDPRLEGVIYNNLRLSKNREWEAIPDYITAQFLSELPRVYPMAYEDEQLVLKNGQIWLYENGSLTGVYDKLDSLRVLRALDGVSFSFAQIQDRIKSKREINKDLTKGGIERNPGPEDQTNDQSDFQKY